MTAQIADLFFRALLDDTQLQKDAEAAGGTAGETLGKRMSSGMSGKLRAGLAVVGTGLGIATKAMLELDDATASFAANTGATADEANRARKAINEMAGRNLQGIREIGSTLEVVHTDMGLVGDQAEATTEQFLRFADVTKRDAAAEVSAFDDILDAWGGTAADIVPIMDKLVKSHQEYGGSIAADQVALKQLAPTLKAFNLGIDDAIGLLNLFKESGLDAALAPRALTAALRNLGDETLPDFIARLSEIQDPGERAAEAIRVFGSRAGPQLANAIRPGRDSLDDFKISAEDATDATLEASDAIRDTFSNKVELAIKGITSELTKFGDAFGPALTGLASIATLGSALGLDKLLGGVVTKFAEVGREAGEAFIDASATAVGTLGTIFGNLIASALDPHQGLLGNPIARVATAAGKLWGSIFAATTRLAEGLTGAILAIPGVRAVKDAIAKTGVALGAQFGAQFAIGIALAAPVIAVGIVDALRNATTGGNESARLAEQYGIGFADSLANATIDELRARRADIGNAYATALVRPGGFDPLLPLKSFFGPENIFGPTDAQRIKAELDKIDAFIVAWEAAHPQAGIEVPIVFGPPAPTDEQKAIAAAGAAGKRIGASVGSMAAEWTAANYGERLVLMGHEARMAGANTALALAAGLRSRADTIRAAMKQLREDIAKGLSPSKTIARAIARLTSKAVADGLKDGRETVRKQAEGTRGLIEDELIETIQAGGEVGEEVMRELERKMNSKDPSVRRQARRTKELIDAALRDPTAGPDPGDKIGSELADDLKRYGPVIGRIAYQIGKLLVANLRAGVTDSAPVSGDGGGGGGGGTRPRRPLQSGLDYVPYDGFLATLHRGEMVVPPREAEALRTGALPQSVGPITVNVDARGNANPERVGWSVRQGIHDAIADVLREQTARLPAGTRA